MISKSKIVTLLLKRLHSWLYWLKYRDYKQLKYKLKDQGVKGKKNQVKSLNQEILGYQTLIYTRRLINKKIL